MLLRILNLLKKTKTLLFIFCILSFAWADTSHASMFNRNLSIGHSGDDVFVIQKILNSDPETLISESGIGSKGKETDYFGPLTLDAIHRFQTKYFNDILKPANLNFPTGFVGPLTRKKLESVFQNFNENNTPNIFGNVNASTSPSKILALIDKPKISDISDKQGEIGDLIFIYGKYFKSSDRLSVLFNYKNFYYYMWDVNILNDGLLSIEIPEDLESNTYTLYVTNETEVSDGSLVFTVK